MRRFIVLLAIVAAIAGCKKAEQAEPVARGSDGKVKPAAKPAPAVSGGDVGQAMPAYTARHLDGSPFELAGERNKVVMLNVWATWCGPCVFEIPELQALHNKYGARGFEVIGASVDEGDPQVVKDFAAEHKMTYPLVHDPEGRIAAILDAGVLPTTVLIDRSGRIVWKRIGQITPKDEELEKAIEKAL